MFPNGIIYEGVDDTKRYYRGESGANDSIIPTLDNLLQVPDWLPENPLTEALKEFRTYRPKNHNDWLSYVYDEARKHKVFDYALSDSLSAYYFLLNLE